MTISRPALWLVVLALVGGPGARVANAAPFQQPVAPAASATHEPLQHQLRQHDAEVSRLQRQVSQQEARSRRADERLRQQDAAIEALRKQLEALQGASPAASTHP